MSAYEITDRNMMLLLVLVARDCATLGMAAGV